MKVIFLRFKRGKATTNNGIIIEADTFEYNKITNILKLWKCCIKR